MGGSGGDSGGVGGVVSHPAAVIVVEFQRRSMLEPEAGFGPLLGQG